MDLCEEEFGTFYDHHALSPFGTEGTLQLMFSTSLHAVKPQFALLFKAAQRKCLWTNVNVGMPALVMSRGNSSGTSMT